MSSGRRATGGGSVVAELRGEELRALRATLRELVVDMNATMALLDDDAKRAYAQAEQSVLDARRKVETREGLLRVG
jgi:hypothetical protein